MTPNPLTSLLQWTLLLELQVQTFLLEVAFCHICGLHDEESNQDITLRSLPASGTTVSILCSLILWTKFSEVNIVRGYTYILILVDLSDDFAVILMSTVRTNLYSLPSHPALTLQPIS